VAFVERDTQPGRDRLPPGLADTLARGDVVVRPRSGTRPTVQGPALALGSEKLTICGVTYGPLCPRPRAPDGWDPAVVRRDLASIVAHGAYAIRTYTVPPRWLLDEALEAGLFVLAGVPWEQHIDFLAEGRAATIRSAVRDAARFCAEHPALLAIAIGNEIPAGVVRWLGRRRVERFLDGLCSVVRDEDPGALVTYVSYPSTEYLRLPGTDVLASNVYLEDRGAFARYLARLQNLADDRPLLLAELGLDSVRHGAEAQARLLADQVATVERAGAAGSFVFAWTDEWYRGGLAVEDWAFGLTTRTREPRPALRAVSDVWSVGRHSDGGTDRISVIVCTYNGATTLAQCLEGLLALDYPDYEILVVDDGSTDDSAAIAHRHGVRVISTPNRGLSAARNTGAAWTSGEIIAYIDDDARPDRDWLTHLASAFTDPAVLGAGGPNVLPPNSGAVATCVANAPGGPTHVLLSDSDAEHLPGCNLAVRRTALDAIGGFDERFRVAGDDVDLCWRLIDHGGRLAFAPGAVVEHHRRGTVRGYLRQQRGYGHAEALLEDKWPERYTQTGQIEWAGRIYGNGSAQHRGGRRWRVYYGAWGSASFQSLYGPRGGLLQAMPLMPEWWLLIGLLTLLSAAGIWIPACLVALPLLILATGAMGLDATLGAARARLPQGMPRHRRLRLRLLTGALYVLQPLARLWGRMERGLSPWRRLGPRRPALPRSRRWLRATSGWRDPLNRVEELLEAITAHGLVLRSGGDWDRFDARVSGGMMAGARLCTLVEEHGHGRQVVRVRAWPHLAAPVRALLATLAAATIALALAGHLAVAGFALTAGCLTALRSAVEIGRALRAIGQAIEELAL
jgi:GT2 family glycosyltransferase